MAGAGALTIFMALRVMPLRLLGLGWVLAITGALTVGIMSAVNFFLHSDFRLVLAVPSVIWTLGLVLYARRT